jgi:hypothetical protein
LIYFLAFFRRLAGVFFDDDEEPSFDDEALLKCFNFIFILSESEELESLSLSVDLKTLIVLNI